MAGIRLRRRTRPLAGPSPMALSLAERDRLRSVLERWLACNADADAAAITIRVGAGGAVVETTETKGLGAVPDAGLLAR
jgi:hypothetical protein